MPTRTTIHAVAGLVVTGSLAFAGCDVVSGLHAARYTEQEVKKFTVTGKPDVSLATFDGAIEIRPSDRQEVAVTIEKQGSTKEAVSRIQVRAEQTGNKIVVDVQLPKTERLFHMNAGAKLTVTLPAESTVQARSGDGSIDIERVSGAVDLQSGDGHIAGRALTGGVKCHTGDGSIKLEDVRGDVDVDTGDGSVTVSGTLSAVRAKTGDGTVTIKAAAGSSAGADWNVQTGDGSIVLEVPDGFGAELDAHTGDGSIAVRDVTLSNVTGQLNRETVRGRLGAGGHSVRLRTGDGSITLRRS